MTDPYSPLTKSETIRRIRQTLILNENLIDTPWGKRILAAAERGHFTAEDRYMSFNPKTRPKGLDHPFFRAYVYRNEFVLAAHGLPRAFDEEFGTWPPDDDPRWALLEAANHEA